MDALQKAPYLKEVINAIDVANPRRSRWPQAQRISENPNLARMTLRVTRREDLPIIQTLPKSARMGELLKLVHIEEQMMRGTR